jgi:hypothetical protein
MAISPYYVNAPSTVDAQIGLSADLTGMLIDSCSASAERDEVEHQNYAAVPTVHIARTPKYTMTFGAKVMVRNAGITNSHPGTSLTRSAIAQFRTGVNHGFELDQGWWMVGNVTHTQPRGDLDEINFPVRIVGFPTNATGTVVVANPVAP